MAREVAHGEIVIGVDLDKVGAELRHAEMQFQRSMANIDRMKAEAKAGVDSTKLDRKVAEAKRRLLELDKMTPTAKADIGTKKFDAEYAKLKAKLRDLNQEKIEMRVDTKELRDANRLSRIAAQNQQLMAKRSLELAKVEERKQKTWRDGAALQQRAIDLDRKRAIEIEKLRVQYIRLHDEVEKGQKLALFDFLGDETARRKFAKTSAELASVGNRLRELGDSDRDLHRLGRASDSAGTRLRNMLTSVGSIRIQMGFLSATLRQTAIGFTALGPVVFGLLGQIVSLVGVLGTGLTGALAVTSAGLAGFGLTALGIGLIMKPLIGDLQDAMKASKAYDDAVRKYGRGSTQAASAQEKLNKTLGDVGPQTRKAFESLGSLSSRWSNMTSSSRPVFFEAMASGIQALNRLLPMFARESNSAFSMAGKEAKRWFSMLSSDEATAGIQQIMLNFTAAFPAISGGFRSLTAMMGRVSVSASKLLPQLTQGFKDWAEGLSDSVGSVDSLDQKIERLVEHMRQVGRFAQSTGAMLAAFFNAGANEGATLLNTLTSIFDRWTAWMQTAGGQASLASFFAEANSIGSQFVGTLASMGVALFEFSSAFAPLSQGFLAAINGVTSLVAALMGLSAARGIVTTLGGALAGAFVVSKLMAAASAIGAIVTAVRTLGAIGTVTTLASLANPLMGLGALAGAAVAALSLLSSAGDRTRASLDSLEASMAKTSAAIDAMAGLDAQAASSKIALSSAQAAARSATEAAASALEKYGKGSREARDAENARQAALQAVSDAESRAAASAKEVYTNRKEATAGARKELAGFEKQLATAQKTLAQSKKSDWTSFGAPPGSDPFAKIKRGLTDAIGLTADQEKAAEDVERAYRDQQEALSNIRRLKNELANSDLDARRRAQGLASVTQDVGAAWRNVRKELPKEALSKIIRMDPKDAAAAIKLTSSLKDLGQSAQAGKIIVNSKSIDEALAKLRRLNKTTSTLVEAKVKKGTAERDLANLGKGKTATIQTKADTKNADKQLKGLSGKQIVSRLNIRADNKDAISKLNAVQARKLQTKLVKIGASPQAAMAAIALINGKKIPEKIAKFKAQSAEAESANKKVQGFKDKSVNVRTKADLSGALAAKSAIEAVPSSKTSTITTVHKTVGSPGGRAAGGPAAGAYNYDPLPAQQRRNAQSADRASVRQNRPGIYRRPTLLVGEENQDEFVIATNPSYRAANERYLEEAASRFGYKLSPFDEMAAKGKGASKSAARYGRSRTSYDYIRSEINRLTELSALRESERANDVSAGRTPAFSLAQVLKPLQTALSPWHNRLEANVTRRANQAAKAADRNRAKGPRLTKQLAEAKKELRAARKSKNDKRIRAAEKKVDRLRDARQKARDAYRDRGNTAGELWRELRGLSNERHDLRNRIAGLRDGTDGAGGSGSAGNPLGVQLAALDQQRYDLFKQFGSNVAQVSGGTPNGQAGVLSSPAFYQSGAGAPASRGGGGSVAPAYGAGSAGTVVNQNISIAEPPPDPHSFSKALGWEAGIV